MHANTGRDFSSFIDSVLPGLLKHCNAVEEGVRNMVAECLGALLSMHGDQIIGNLLELVTNDEDRLSRWTITSALRFSLSRQINQQKAVTFLSMDQMRLFLSFLNDTDLEVRRAALILVNASIHHQPDLIFKGLETFVVPTLLQTLEFKQERTVDLGPFKHKVLFCNEFIELYADPSITRLMTACL